MGMQRHGEAEHRGQWSPASIEDADDARDQDADNDAERSGREYQQQCRIDQGRAHARADLRPALQKIGELAEHRAEMAADLAGADHAQIVRREDPRLLLHCLRQRQSVEHAAAQILGDGGHGRRCAALAEDAKRVVERDIGAHQRGEFSREGGKLTRRAAAAHGKFAAPPRCLRRADRLHLKRGKPLRPEELCGQVVRRRIDLSFGEFAARAVGGISKRWHRKRPASGLYSKVRRKVCSMEREVTGGGKLRRSSRRNSSVIQRASLRVRMTIGVIRMINSVLSAVLSLVLKALPRAGMSPKSGTCERVTVLPCSISPPSASPSPLFTTTLVRMRRWRMVGESIPDEVVGTTLETSCSRSSSTRPLALIRGVIARMTPVSL